MTVRNSLVFGATAADGVALGMAAVDEATLLAEDVTVSKNENNGIVITAAKAELTRVLVTRNYGLEPDRGSASAPRAMLSSWFAIRRSPTTTSRASSSSARVGSSPTPSSRNRTSVFCGQG
jgi:hypothetical protein